MSIFAYIFFMVSRHLTLCFFLSYSDHLIQNRWLCLITSLILLQLETSLRSMIYFLKLSWVFNFLNFKLLCVQYLQKMWIVTTSLKVFFNPLLRQLIKFLQSKYFPSNAVKTNYWLIFRNPITLNRYLLSVYEDRDWIILWGYKNRSMHTRHLQNPAEKKVDL